MANNCDSDALEIVFQYLTINDLSTVSLVCKQWNEIVNTIRRKHNEIITNILICNTLSKRAFLLQKLFENFIKLKNSSHQLCILLVNYKLYERYCEKIVENFNLKSTFDYHMIPGMVNKELKEILPRGCKSLILKCIDMVGTDSTGKILDSESHVDYYSISYALLPKIDGVNIHRFTIGADEYNSNYNELLNLKKDEEIKLIIITGFGLDKELPMDYTLNSIKREQKYTFCNINVIKPEFKIFGEDYKMPNKLEGVAITGNNFFAMSIKIQCNDFITIDCEPEISKLKQSNCNPNKSICIMFMDEKAFRNVQEYIFIIKKHLPGTPVIGLDVLKVITKEFLKPELIQQESFTDMRHRMNKLSLTKVKPMSKCFSDSLLLAQDETLVVVLLLWWD